MAFGFSQNSPELKVKGKPLGLSSLDIKVNIVGNIATTTYDMLFHNPTNSILEGELSFPLGDGHDVSRFALDVNGKLREAVVVDKELGRVAFEHVVRRGVDPALLEKGTGNNYNARIYPIPANGYKRVLLAYEQELAYNGGDHYYNLPLNFKNKLSHFGLEITVFDQKEKPVIDKGNISDLEFSNWDKNYKTSIIKKNFIANKNISVKVPVPVDTKKTLTYDNYFYVYKTINPQKRLRDKPNEIALFWDASLSMKDRNIQKELKVLEGYFENLTNVTVHFVSFSNTVLLDKQFKVVNGNWDKLKNTIENTIYDGGTNYDIIYNLKNKVDAKLIFSDGMPSLSNIALDIIKPLFIVNSITKSNHTVLNHLAESSNGAYINLSTRSNDEALAYFKYENYKYLGYESNSKSLEVYPKSPMSVTNDFSISGKYLKGNETITLNFGYGNDIKQRMPISIEASGTSFQQVKRIWAQKKLKVLEINSKENQSQITKLGTEYGLVTDYTSLIVLENVMDYVTYKIIPPAELLEEYNETLARIESQKSVRHETTDFFMESPALPTAPDTIEIVEDEEIVEAEEMVVERVQSSGVLNAFSEVDAEVTNDSEILDLEMNLEVANEDDIPFAIIDKAPIFPGCEGNNQGLKNCFSKKVSNHVKNHFNLEIANDLGLGSGRQRINVLFAVSSEGIVSRIRVRSPHSKITEEVERIIQLLPRMKPGEQRDRPIDVLYSLPIMFNLEENGRTIQVEQIEQQARTPSFKKYSGELTIKKRKVETKYISQLQQVKNKEEAYKFYLSQREEHIKTPAYYVDVSNYFKTQFNDSNYSHRILSNLSETDFDNYELLKVYAYQLQDSGEDDLAVFIFKRIQELRPEDSQSYRDLALAYESIGRCQKALDLYNGIITGRIYEGNHRRVFKGIALIAQNEIKHLIKKYKNDLDLSQIDKRLLEEVAYDIRVVVDWNHNDTDIDLHIIDPNLEECFYKHTSTRIGGQMSPDMTQGFGPEEFTLKRAIKGDYYIKIKYYGDRNQKIESPTFMKVTMFKHYGSKNESKETKIIRLTKKDDEEIIAKLSF